jgi:MFS family permease
LGLVAVRRSLGTVAAVFREPHLRRLELAWAGFYFGEWTQFIALSIYAYEHGGATSVGLFGLIRMGLAAAALPFGAVLTDRYPRQRVLVGIYVARAVILAVTAAALAEGSPRALVFALAGLAATAAAPVRPATMSLVPLLARTPAELVAANVSASTMEGAGTLAGPLLGGVVTAAFNPDAAVGAAAAVYLACAFAVHRIHREGQVAARAGGRGAVAELVLGAQTLAREPQPRLIVGLFGSQTLVRGLLNVLLTVAALDALRIGDAGVGWLNATLGAGAFVGGFLTTGLVTRRRLAMPFALALVLWGAPISVIGLSLNAVTAFACVAVIGVGNALLDVTGFTLMQRTVDEYVLGRVFGVFEVVVAASVAAGSALGSLEIEQLGLRDALLVSGLLLPALALVSAHRLRAIDDASQVPQRSLALVSALPLFAPLPVTTRERLACKLRETRAQAGTTIVEEGAAGDCFYLLAAGEVDVLQSGRRVATLGPGDHFGEIALLRSTPRTASCVARTDAELYAIEGPTFVAAVSGDLRSIATADEAIAARLGADAHRAAVVGP